MVRSYPAVGSIPIVSTFSSRLATAPPGCYPVVMERRTLRFHDFDEVLRDADGLLAAGYDRAGTWGLAQVADHLTRAITLSLDGYPSLYPWPMRLVARWFYLPRIRRHQVLRRRVSAPQFLLPADAGDDRAAVERFRAAVERFGRHTGSLHPSPIFGTLDRGDWREVHLWHCEHHFSFLHPRPVPAGGPPQQ